MGGSYGGGYNSYSPYNNDPYSQPGLPPTFGSQIHNSTAPAFAVLESLVGAFTSLAQLFESTYIATHSSFYAMVGVADQLGGLKTYLAQVLGVFSVLRLGRKIVAFLKGDRTAFRSSSGPLGASGTNWAEEWNWKIGRAAGGPGDQSLHPPSGPTSSKRPSSKPLLLFLLSSIGLPWLMTKLIRLLTRIQEEKRMASIGPGSELAGNQGNAAGGQITFARALWPFEAGAEHELALKRDEIVAILQRHEAGQEQGQGRELGWWRGRTRDGRTGWFPGNYVSVDVLFSI
jgi:peroxin-13